ncbi:MAG TPA: geranylgeranylglycerol-phosphate geranylgeranyltransferase [Cytophagaceae bacterium]|nr:geranylgeranylglycerol-phosphate geranylgeranyltransferase [Cytophagaceae bacterium]
MATEPSIPKKIFLFLKLIRFQNLIIIFVSQYFAAIFLLKGFADWSSVIADPHMFSLSMSTLFIAAGGYIINDYYDVKIDMINKPERIVVGMLMKRRTAIVLHIFINLAGIITGFVVNWKVGMISGIISFLLWLYSVWLKKTAFAGNILISLLSAASLLLLIFYYRSNIEVIFIYAIFAFFISLIREIIKDMEDMKGDAAFGSRTLPIIIGIRKTKTILFLLIIVFTSALIISGLRIQMNVLAYLGFFVLPPLIWLSYSLARADSSRDFTRLSFLCKYIMLSGIVSMAFM